MLILNQINNENGRGLFSPASLHQHMGMDLQLRAWNHFWEVVF
jgi:hypothetical protein